MLCLIFKCVSIRICLSFQPRLITNLPPRALIPPIANVVLCEPELIEEAFKLEKSIDVPCFVTPTEGITEARLAYARFEGRAEEMARIAYETSAQFSPQHLIAAIGPTGLTQLLPFHLNSRRSSITMPFWR